MILRGYIALVLVFLNAREVLHAQNNWCATAGASVQLTVLAGGNLDFIFNSIAKYKTGVPSTTQTVIGITITDPAALPDYATWEITVEAEDLDGDGFLTGMDPANQVPFNTIELTAAATGPGCVGCVFAPPLVALPDPLNDGPADCVVPLTDTGTLLVNGVLPGDRTNADSQIVITYRCGFPPNSLLGFPADYYTDTIIYTLSAYE